MCVGCTPAPLDARVWTTSHICHGCGCWAIHHRCGCEPARCDHTSYASRQLVVTRASTRHEANLCSRTLRGTPGACASARSLQTRSGSLLRGELVALPLEEALSVLPAVLALGDLLPQRVGHDKGGVVGVVGLPALEDGEHRVQAHCEEGGEGGEGGERKQAGGNAQR